MKDISLKKIIIIFVSLFSLVIVVTSVYFYNKAIQEKNSKPLSFKNDYEKQQYISNFAKAQGKDPNKEINENSGGYNGLILENKQELLNYMNLDGMLSVNTRLIEDLKYIDKFSNETKNSNISEYYKDNKDVINTLFGFKNINDFKQFLNKLKFAQKSKITKASIEKETIIKDNSTVNFNLTIFANNKYKTFKISVIVTEDNQKFNSLITWIN